MSMYRDFRKCTVCRSNQLRSKYKGDLGVTMLLNSMYLAVMQQLEKIEGSGLTSKQVLSKLQEINTGIINDYDNNFVNCASDKVVKCLRRKDTYIFLKT